MTPAQAAIFAADLAQDGSLSQLPHNSDSADTIAMAYNQLAIPAYYVWSNTTRADAVMDAITWASLTPTDTADGTTLWTNRALMCQAKQLNLQIMLQGRDTVSSGKANIRAGLTDALQNVPSGVAGALVDAGWLGAGKVKTTLTRQATRLEKLFATGSGTTGTPSALGYDGQASYQEITAALVW